MIRRLLLFLLLAAAPAAFAQNGSFQNWCQAGNTLPNTSGLISTTPVQGSFPKCQISVFVTGARRRVIQPAD